jgi:predicted nucleic acid-binding protein
MSPAKIIVSDAGPLIALAKTKNLDILKKLFEKIIIPPCVYDELRISTSRAGSDELRAVIETTKWLEVSKPVEVLPVLINSLHQGEAEAIALAKQQGLVLLIDEKKGRKIAKKEKVKITGIGAVLVAAKRKAIINNVSSVIDELMTCGYRISKPLRQKILRLAEEE